MPQDKSAAPSPDQQRMALADAAWRLLATHHIDRIDIMVANLAAVPHGARALGGSVQRLVLAKMQHSLTGRRLWKPMPISKMLVMCQSAKK